MDRGFISAEQHAALIVDDDLTRLMAELQRRALAVQATAAAPDYSRT